MFSRQQFMTVALTIGVIVAIRKLWPTNPLGI